MIPINMYTMQLLIINSKTTKPQSNMGFNTSISRKSHCAHEVGLRPYFQKPGHQLLTFFNYREYVVCTTIERNSGADLRIPGKVLEISFSSQQQDRFEYPGFLH